MPLLSFSGLATGLDTSGMVTQLVAVERAPIRRIQAKQAGLESRSEKFSNVKSLLEKLQEAARALDTRSESLTSLASSSQEGAVKATASGGAALGAFDIEVTGLAYAERTYSDPVSAKDQAGLFGSGQISIQVGDQDAVAIDVSATDTLQSVASAINASDAKVTAAVLFDGESYRLQVTGDETGVDNAITFGESGTTLGLTDPDNQVQAATDAAFTIDGFEMTRSQNTVTDAIAGVTLELLAETDGEATVTVQRDNDAIKEKLQAFVDAYNEVASTIAKESTFTGQPRGADSLVGDSTLRGLQSRLRSVIGAPVSELSGAYQTLYSIGVRSQSDGTLAIDDSALDAALADDPEAVAAVLGKDGGATGVLATLDSTIDDYVRAPDGLLTQRIDGVADRIDGLDDQIDRMEIRIAKYEESLRSEFAALETLVSGLQAQNSAMLALLGQGQV